MYKHLESYRSNEDYKGTTFARKLKDGRLRGIAIYGVGWGGKYTSKRRFSTTRRSQFDGNRLVATGSRHANKERLEGEFEPLMARYSSDRNNFGIKGARAGRLVTAGGRKALIYLKIHIISLFLH